MFLGKLRNRLTNQRLSLRVKLTLSLSAIAVVLVISSIISLMEYRSMSSYVSGLIADNINSINVAQKLSEVSNGYNLDILSVIGDEGARLPNFNQEEFVARCDSLKKNLTSVGLLPLADSVMYSYAAYMLTTLELEDVLLSDFIDSRTWYFDRLQPKYNRLRGDIDALSAGMYNDLKKNSETFERGFYRSIIPGLVAVLAGLILVVLLLFFILAYYVRPINKMLASLGDYRSFGKKYTYNFEGDDPLSELNAGISDLAGENQQLRKRLTALRNSTINQDER
jgi:predicted PurR-regulated permease PerM